MIKGVPSWIEGTAVEWAKEMRRFEKKLGNIQGTLGRIHEEGPVGASIRQVNDNIPNVIFYDHEVRKFHLVWLDLDVQERNHIWVHFKEFGKIKDKVAKLETNNRMYYRMLRNTLNQMAQSFHFYD